MIIFLECAKRGLWWRGLLHDLSKFLPSEFLPYACYFYGPRARVGALRDGTGYYKPTDTGDAAFDFAWLLHQKRNDHHWQWWVLPENVAERWTVTETAMNHPPMLACNGDSLARLEIPYSLDDGIYTAANDVARRLRDRLSAGAVKVLPMSHAARLEMMCDWIGASRAQGHGGMDAPTGVRAWYAANADRMQLHPETRAWVERLCRGGSDG